ncbi:N-alpha-acetyltransferase 25, NatB auxiliary subunit [Harpegnathos saltator]|uniref:N-terminal acetyltransferase B complex subunit MDM20 homolog n=1 Tax=Harpegnathos saltator TaxID=610380 RepID=E2BAH2_HARSA|nr:N-alpha-acetyltransferase 25, NatB auxiliary subunit [Harpegnathos saltator]EFN87304.1 TPR repeat-containing protein C12orf30-like protein [Harpegnathos saltator]
MASRSHVDNTVNERRLRPIYDWLDNGNNKKALQEADKVLRKQPGNQCARVLKALALLRLGKQDECHVIMDKVQSEVPCEDSTLQAMSICYRETLQPDKISEVYEAAAKADPHNEELLTHLFMSYVRLGDYKKQQQTALALYKVKPKNPYYFWAVMSIVMQATHSDEKLAKGVMLPLAERMVLKLVQEGKMEAEQEVQLYLMILELQDKNEEILNVLSSPLASHLSYVPQRKATLLLKLERFPEAAEAYQELIRKNTDNWTFYQNYLSMALKFQQPTECLDFFNDIINMSENKIRAPYLARLELLKRTCTNGDAQYNLQSVDLMHQYFSQFGGKGCVVSDLRLYLNILTPEGKVELLERIEKDIGVAPDEFPSTVQQMQKHIHLEQLRRICGFHHSPLTDKNKQEELIKRLCDLYEKGNELCPVQERLPTDFCPADSYILLASHLLHQLWVDTSDASFLYRAISLLERSLLSSPANFHVKILLVRMYLEVGLVVAADRAFALLDVKHLQLDSLGHLHVPLLASLGDLPLASTTLDHTAKFFIANYKDSADHLTFAYKYGSFVKIQEFVELRERLENSFHFATTTVDKMLLDLCWCDSTSSFFSSLNSMHIQPNKDSVRWDSLRDNRNLEVVYGWEPLNQSEGDPRMREETRLSMLRLLGARSLMLRILVASAESDSSILFSQLSAELKQLDDEHIPHILQKFDADGKQNRPCNILVPLDAVERLREAHCSEQLKTIARLAKSLSHSPCPDSDCIQMLRASPCLQTLLIPVRDTPVSFKNFLLRATTCSESLAVITAICSSTYAIQSKPHAAQKKNRKKCNKKIESDMINETNESKTWREIAMLLSERIRDLDAVLTEFEKYELYTGLDEKDDVSVSIAKRGQTSLGQSCRALKSRAQLTLRFLSNLKS